MRSRSEAEAMPRRSLEETEAWKGEVSRSQGVARRGEGAEAKPK